MTQYSFKQNQLTLSVAKSSLFVRGTLFVFAGLFFMAPISSILFSVISGKGFHMGFMVMLFLFSIMGYYLLRIALWNTFGKEVITFNNNRLTYLADYGWFKDALKSKEIEPLQYSIRRIGFEEDQKGALVIGDEGNNIQCATKMKTAELNELISQLKTMNK